MSSPQVVVDPTKGITGIREEDEVIPTVLTHPVTGNRIERDVVLSAEWVKYIRQRFQARADGVLQYMLSLKQELIQQAGDTPWPALAHSWHFEQLWDKETNRLATPEQKMVS